PGGGERKGPASLAQGIPPGEVSGETTRRVWTINNGKDSAGNAPWRSGETGRFQEPPGRGPESYRTQLRRDTTHKPDAQAKGAVTAPFACASGLWAVY